MWLADTASLVGNRVPHTSRAWLSAGFPCRPVGGTGPAGEDVIPATLRRAEPPPMGPKNLQRKHAIIETHHCQSDTNSLVDMSI
ncbi:hypothetical protein PsYK624_109020 [Phanerochaete sordida]|uniref:Uncharacterized protein n=1 Tax=Phanerochaete sordida TaxID=48140 RepID=A0A9P3GGX3_9APHY|nr:hypothetical protein PsYK624_109020 [Phanerochaete sordida]